jgi:hypothetical protein
LEVCFSENYPDRLISGTKFVDLGGGRGRFPGFGRGWEGGFVGFFVVRVQIVPRGTIKSMS